MEAAYILSNIAILLLAAALWDDMKRGERLTPMRKTWLLVASLFALISALLQLIKL